MRRTPAPAPLRRAARLLQMAVPRAGSDGIHCFAYHLVGAGTGCSVDVDGEHFQHQLTELGKRAESVESLLGSPDSRLAGAGPRAIVTFDDAFGNFTTHAWPRLKAASIPVVLYVPTGFIERKTAAPLQGAEGEEPLSWAALRELVSSELVTIGSHSHSHRDLPRLDDEDLREELHRSKAILEDWLGVPVRHFCCPRGRWDRRVEEAVFEHYQTSAVAGGRMNRSGSPPRRIHRIPIRRDSPISLRPMLRSRLWLEEWFADRWRNRRIGSS